jgi:hypothetical protein
MQSRSFKDLFNAFHSVRKTNSPVRMQGWAHNHRMHAFKYGKKEHFAIDFQVLHKKKDKVFRENRLHNIPFEIAWENITAKGGTSLTLHLFFNFLFSWDLIWSIYF